MVGKNLLWVAKQHGHSVTTMLRIYTAWAEGAIEADIEAIKRAMKQRPTPPPPAHRVPFHSSDRPNAHPPG
jgi:hypothetical protein